MAKITIETLRKRIANDHRQWGTPFEQQQKVLGYVEADHRLRICPQCEGEQGYITSAFHYTTCPVCSGRGVLRRHWWMYWVPLPLSFHDE